MPISDNELSLSEASSRGDPAPASAWGNKRSDFELNAGSGRGRFGHCSLQLGKSLAKPVGLQVVHGSIAPVIPLNRISAATEQQQDHAGIARLGRLQERVGVPETAAHDLARVHARELVPFQKCGHPGFPLQLLAQAPLVGLPILLQRLQGSHWVFRDCSGLTHEPTRYILLHKLAPASKHLELDFPHGFGFVEAGRVLGHSLEPSGEARRPHHKVVRACALNLHKSTEALLGFKNNSSSAGCLSWKRIKDAPCPFSVAGVGYFKHADTTLEATKEPLSCLTCDLGIFDAFG